MAIRDELAKLTLEQLQDVPPAVTTPPPDFATIDKAKGLAVLNKLREVEKYGGHTGIAASENVPVVWVRKLDVLRREVIAEKLAAEPE